MKALHQIIGSESFDLAEKKSFPRFEKPMFATLTDDYFDDPEWIYERKLDGERCLVFVEAGRVSFFSRNNQILNNTYPELVDAIAQEDYPNLILDGEIVAFNGKNTSFSKLQNRINLKDPTEARASKVTVYIYFFDIIYYENFSLKKLPLRQRKKILKEAIKWRDPIRFVSHQNEQGIAYHREACQKGWEGIIAKDGNSNYESGRSKSWLKFKCTKGQELVIGGFTEPEGERVGFGALLVGFYKGGKLQYAGKVGTGYDDDFLTEWRRKFEKIEQDFSPFENFKDDKGGNNHWIEPKYVGEFGFTEWTKNNRLRHPRFMGMRYDKEPKEVIKEEPK